MTAFVVFCDEDVSRLKQALDIQFVKFIAGLQFGKLGARLIHIQVQYELVYAFKLRIKLPYVINGP